MNAAEFSGAVLIASLLAGMVGSLTGLGGGVIVTPVLTILLHVDLRYAIGASLISVIATSSGSAAAYVRDGLSNIRIGMFLEIATTLGALFGAFLAAYTPTGALSVIFGIILLQSAWQASRNQGSVFAATAPDPVGARLKLNGSLSGASEDRQPYQVRRVKSGFALMFGAGTLSGLLGIGSGSLKVIAMDQVMQIPFKVSTATSNFMIGVTAAASASVYLTRGYVDPRIVMPVMLGVLAGSMLGARLLPRLPVSLLRKCFAIIVGIGAVEMIYAGFGKSK
jgi:uncharacterized protein